MVGAQLSDARVARYELEIEIDASPETVWSAIINDTNAWWLPDFHMVGAESRITLEPHAGGALIEELEGGGSLLWYTVNWIDPRKFILFLVGNLSPDFGGPSCTHLKLAIESRGDGSVLKVTDAHYGNVDDATLESLKGGWKSLFGDGLKAFIER